MTDLQPCGHPLPSRKWWESSSRQCDLWGRYEDGKCYMHSVSAEAVAKRAAKSAKQSASHARQKDPSSATSTAYEKRWCDALLANPTTHTRCWRIGRFPDGRCARVQFQHGSERRQLYDRLAIHFGFNHHKRNRDYAGAGNHQPCRRHRLGNDQGR